jgi:SAM-dependent methyltransferase
MSDRIDALINDAIDAASRQEGWGFSYVKGRRHLDGTPWSWRHEVCSRLSGVQDMLDMDTGGGEMLIGLKEHAKMWPEHVCATEGYQPNIEVAKRNLQPIGVDVFEFERYENLPFSGNTFDLITNRHGDFRATEINRILSPGGIFITQQIGTPETTSFGNLLDGPPPEYPPTVWADVVASFENAGFEIEEQQEFVGKDVFDDIGAIVFVITMAPWELPDFSADVYRERLRRAQRSIEINGPIDLGRGFSLLVAHKRGDCRSS